MSAFIGSHDLGDNFHKVEENSPPPNPSLITIEKPKVSSGTIESVQKEPLCVADNAIIVQEGFEKDQQTIDVVNKQDALDKNEEIYDSRDHKDKSSDIKLERDVPMQDQGCPEIVEHDVLEGNEEINVSRKSYGEDLEESNDCQLQLEKDSPVISDKQLSDIVEQDISCGQNENTKKLETDTPMESDDSHNDQLHSVIQYNFTASPQQVTGAWQEFESPKSNFLKGCKWSPDGSCVLTNSDDNVLRIFNLPVELYNGSAVQGLSEMVSVLQMPEGETVYDYCWYPFMSSLDPDTCCLLSSSRDHPIHMWDAFTGTIRCTYRTYNHLDELVAANCVSFNLDGSCIFCGFNKMIRIFDTTRPGRDFQQRPTTGFLRTTRAVDTSTAETQTTAIVTLETDFLRTRWLNGRNVACILSKEIATMFVKEVTGNNNCMPIETSLKRRFLFSSLYSQNLHNIPPTKETFMDPEAPPTNKSATAKLMTKYKLRTRRLRFLIKIILVTMLSVTMTTVSVMNTASQAMHSDEDKAISFSNSFPDS